MAKESVRRNFIQVGGLRVCLFSASILENPIINPIQVATKGIITEWNATTKLGKKMWWLAIRIRSLASQSRDVKNYRFNWNAPIIHPFHWSPANNYWSISCWNCWFWSTNQSRHLRWEELSPDLTKKKKMGETPHIWLLVVDRLPMGRRWRWGFPHDLYLAEFSLYPRCLYAGAIVAASCDSRRRGKKAGRMITIPKLLLDGTCVRPKLRFLPHESSNQSMWAFNSDKYNDFTRIFSKSADYGKKLDSTWSIGVAPEGSCLEWSAEDPKFKRICFMLERNRDYISQWRSVLERNFQRIWPESVPITDLMIQDNDMIAGNL